MSDVPSITVTPTSSGFEIRWPDGFSSMFHWIWLRDNCRCAACGEPEAGRRQSKITIIPDELTPKSTTTQDDTLYITWSDQHESHFDGAWLRSNAYDEISRQARAFTPHVWTNAVREKPPIVEYDAVANDDGAFLDMLHTIKHHGLCFVSGAPAEPGILESFAAKIGPIQESNFGRIQDLILDVARGQVAQSAVALRPHTDEPYRASPPGLLLFHCIETDQDGAGASLFADGFELAEVLRTEDAESFDVLAKYPQAFRRHYPGDVDLIAEFPILTVDPFGNLAGVRINDRVAAPLSIPTDIVPVYYRALRRLVALLEDESYSIKKILSPGEIAIFDNHRVLHGRTELTMTRQRWLQWMQIERGDFHSTMRILADQIQRPRETVPLMRGAYGW